MLLAFFALVIADALGVFDDRPYYEVPHGDHTHYLPKDCDPALPISRAPTRPPEPGERISCSSGRFMPVE